MQHTITPEPISQYTELFSSEESPFLKALNQKTHDEIHGAQMLSGHLQGLVLQFISGMIKPKNILEIGTYTGYSATCLSRGLQKNGQLHTIDIDPSLQNVRNEFWTKEQLQQTIKQHIGPADQIIPKLTETFDLVFIDADKKNYALYFDLVIDKIPTGAWLIADNVLFHGEVILPQEQQSKTAAYMHQFNQKIKTDNRVEQVLIPIRDGLMLMRKK